MAIVACGHVIGSNVGILHLIFIYFSDMLGSTLTGINYYAIRVLPGDHIVSKVCREHLTLGCI